MYQRNAEWAARDRSGQSPAATTDLDSEASEADREAARLRAEAEQAEAKKRGRRIVVTLNKLGAAATGYAASSSPRFWPAGRSPRGRQRSWPTAWSATSYLLTQHDGPATAAELLGIDAAAIHKAVSDLPEGSDNRALVIALALVLGALEVAATGDAHGCSRCACPHAQDRLGDPPAPRRGPSVCPFGHRAGGRVIHLPSMVRMTFGMGSISDCRESDPPNASAGTCPELTRK